MKNTIIGQIAFWGSVIGAILIALHLPISGWAFIPYIVSNIASIYILRKADGPKVITYQAWFFLVINIIGIGRWLL
jgi:hypothetical protein